MVNSLCGQSIWVTYNLVTRNFSETWILGSVTSKKLPNVYKSCPQKYFTTKIKEFDTFTKIAYACWRFGRINCCQRLLKVAQIIINRPIWSHWSLFGDLKVAFGSANMTFGLLQCTLFVLANLLPTHILQLGIMHYFHLTWVDNK